MGTSLTTPHVLLEAQGRQLVLEGDPDVLEMVRAKLAVTSPNFKYIKERQPWNEWDGKIHFLEIDSVNPFRATAGIGLYQRICRILARLIVTGAEGKPVKIEIDDRVDLSTDLVLTVNNLKGPALVKDQIAASEALIAKSTGCIQLDVSSGKSYVALNLLASVLKQRPGLKFALIVPKKNLLYQIFKDAQQVLPDHRIGILGDGHRQLHDITIATAATAVGSSHIKDRKQIQDWLKEVDGILVDEAHHSNAATWKAIYEQSNAQYLWGVSAKFTFGAGSGKKELQMALEACFGPPLFVGAVEEFRVPVVVKAYHFTDWHGRTDPALSSKLVDLTPCRYLKAGKWYRGLYRGPDEKGQVPDVCKSLQPGPRRGEKVLKPDKTLYGVWEIVNGLDKKVEDVEDTVYHTAHDVGIMEFKDRDDWAIAVAQEAASRREIFLVTCNRSRHVHKLARRFEKAGLNIRTLTGQTTSVQTQKIMEDWKAKVIDGVVAQQAVVSEGISIPSLWHLIKLDGQSGEMILHQQKGRPARVEPDKVCGYLHLPVDYQHKTLLKNSIACLEYWKKMQLEVVHLRRATVSEL